MKTAHSLLSFVLLCIVAGCATTFRPWNLSQIQEGMDRPRVLAILGEPDYSVDKEDAEYLYYSYREELAPMPDVSLENIEGLERRVEEMERSTREYKYEVVLVDGKVINYKELQD